MQDRRAYFADVTCTNLVRLSQNCHVWRQTVTVLRATTKTHQEEGGRMAESTVVRMPQTEHLEAKRMAALRGVTPGDLLAEAWREYVMNHRQEFATDLEE